MYKVGVARKKSSTVVRLPTVAFLSALLRPVLAARLLLCFRTLRRRGRARARKKSGRKIFLASGPASILLMVALPVVTVVKGAAVLAVGAGDETTVKANCPYQYLQSIINHKKI